MKRDEDEQAFRDALNEIWADGRRPAPSTVVSPEMFRRLVATGNVRPVDRGRRRTKLKTRRW